VTTLKWLRVACEMGLIGLVIFLSIRPAATPVLWYGSVVHWVPTDQKVVALTYDDGPHPVYTPQLVKILDKYNVKATFFMIGREMDKYPDIVRDVARRGHVIANHTYTHPNDIKADTASQIIRELDMCEQVIERLTGKRAHLFRPPKGLIDGTVFTVAQEEGYRTILWTVCADHRDAPTPELMAQRVVKHIRPGAIILAHDGTFYSRWRDVAATPLIIEALRKKGYRFVTVPELMLMARPSRVHIPRQAAAVASGNG
jgi:peptidoglycan-N-acetylglucosamine deacetylase